MNTEEGFLSFYDKHARAVLRHIYFRVSDWKAAEDLTQEVFFKTWQYVASGKEVNNFKTFIYRVANNIVIDYYRQRSKFAIPMDDAGLEKAANIQNTSQQREVETGIDMELIEKYLLELDDLYRQVLTYRYIDDLSIDEISEITGKTVNNISVIIYRGIKLLKDKITK